MQYFLIEKNIAIGFLAQNTWCLMRAHYPLCYKNTLGKRAGQRRDESEYGTALHTDVLRSAVHAVYAELLSMQPYSDRTVYVAQISNTLCLIMHH